MFRRMRVRIIVALALAVIASVMTFNYLKSMDNNVPVIVASKDIAINEPLTMSNLKELLIDKNTKSRLYPNSVSNKDELIGAITRVPLEKGLPVQKKSSILMFDAEASVAMNKGNKIDESYFIPYDKRVITIDVDATGVVGELLKKGDFVDLIFTSSDDGTGGIYSNMLLQHIQIFSIGKIASGSNGVTSGRSRIQVLASAEDCVTIVVAKRNGTLDLVLNPLNGTTEAIEPVHIMELAADLPMDKNGVLRFYKDMISYDDNLTEATREQIISALEKEESIETIKNVVEGSILNNIEKRDLINRIEDYSTTETTNQLEEIQLIVDQVDQSVLSDIEKQLIVDTLINEADELIQKERTSSINDILDEIKTSNLPETTKISIEKIMTAMKNQKQGGDTQSE